MTISAKLFSILLWCSYHYAVTHLRNKTVTFKGGHQCGSKIFPLREVPILKRDAIEEHHCLVQKSPFDVRNFFRVLATPLFLISEKKTFKVSYIGT